MKGRNTIVVSIRLPDSVYTILKARAKELSVSEYLKKQILHSVNTTRQSHSVNTTQGLTDKLKAVGIDIEGNRIVSVEKQPQMPSEAVTVPIQSQPYNPNKKYKPGDRILAKPQYGRSKKPVEIRVPQIDADGNPIPEV